MSHLVHRDRGLMNRFTKYSISGKSGSAFYNTWRSLYFVSSPRPGLDCQGGQQKKEH